MSSNTHLVFVYGSLKTGSPNNALLVDGHATRLGDAITAERYLLLDGFSFPYLVNPAKLRHMTDCEGMLGRIKGEAYRVDDETLVALDHLESHPRFYKREKIVIENPNRSVAGFAWVYFLNRPLPKRAMVCLPDADGICEWVDSSEEASHDEI